MTAMVPTPTSASTSTPCREDSMHGYYFEELEIGMCDFYGKTVTDADIVMFAGISGDTNPVHLNHEFASKTPFEGRIAHGMLTASFISTVIGTKLPGPGCIYISQGLRFKAPVKTGDTVVARATITKLIPERHFVELACVCTVGERVVLDGEATVMAPSLKR
ncbi:MaoC family dehydratase [Varunaivibrio sulfuroxidans]|uniref:3-hydroxybutyryl-CoA dehydratase n=1 Tax=Varunaivibrio sulfuroxidans TaxID=1773489 RepID=A0A4V6NYG5_9PROT|nr:MaoC family dehydratase [Varunaivibrio sulfuroxidans]TCS60611.1 3-hydroxybutyryl-CoA dehydratase [Varunaivibrio sulfuroxidans]WES30100.1 MaoC family dehydratase [Varunaivibrio sulfuroxidans]